MSGVLKLDGITLATENAGTITLDNLVLGSGVPLPAAGITGTLGSGVFPAGHVVQVGHFETNAVDTGTTTWAHDDTIPQITEGNEFMTLEIEPTSATNKLMVEVIHNIIGSYSGGQAMVGAVFNTDFHATNALACSWNGVMDNYASHSVPIRFYVVAGTTSATTFRFRGGSASAGTCTFNGRASGRQFGGALLSSMTITEIIPPE